MTDAPVNNIPSSSLLILVGTSTTNSSKEYYNEIYDLKMKMVAQISDRTGEVFLYTGYRLQWAQL